MKWVVDTSGRFDWRPYYEKEELDIECEKIISTYLENKYGNVRYPISTDDLAVIVEQDTSDLDLYADLSREGDDVEGLTDFFPRKKPVVRISSHLANPGQEKRLRTTLAHEFGHIRFHKFLWDTTLPRTLTTGFVQKIGRQRLRMERLRKDIVSGDETIDHHRVNLSLGPRPRRKRDNKGPRCPTINIFDAPTFDWMEWQASYACGAFLMPYSHLKALVNTLIQPTAREGIPSSDAEIIERLNGGVAKFFDVSPDAARVRLSRLDLVQVVDYVD
jgi:Zn-dependent peptidase ImmA (M78 family)